MKLVLWTLIALITVAVGRNFYFYADVRWDQRARYNLFAQEEDIPFNHGLRIVPAIMLAKLKIKEGLRIWSSSPRVHGGLVNNDFYQSNAEYVAICKGINGSESGSNCFVNSNYDIGFCSPSGLEPSKDPALVAGLHCKNNPPEGHIFSFRDNINDPKSLSIPFLKKGEKIHIILPDGSGLDKVRKEEFVAKFGSASGKSLSLGKLNDRIQHIAKLFGDDFAGIIGSTEHAYYTSLIAKSLKVPNIVPVVSEKANEGT